MMAAFIMNTSCTSDMEYKDTGVTAVKQLYAPADNIGVELQASASATLFFEWSPALAVDGCAPQYEVVFDKENGDFSNPIYRMVSDNMGSKNYATISHKVLDKICKLAGMENSETGNIKWTVVSSRGITQAISDQVRTLTITSLAGIEDPGQLFLTGEGSEGGKNIAKSLTCTGVASGEYEIFTKLEAGKPYRFVSSKNTGARVFYIDDNNKLKEGKDENVSGTVAETGIYRINLDLNTASVSFKKVVSLGWFFSPENRVKIQMEYQGNGIWKGTGITEFKQQSWGRDERYKFEMVYESNGSESKVHWGPVNAGLDSRPSDNESPAYFYMKEWNTSQWDNKWKLHEKFDGKNTTFTFYLNADAPYHHTVELAQ